MPNLHRYENVDEEQFIYHRFVFIYILRAAVQATQGIQSEHESLIKQLDLLRSMNQKLRDERDSLELSIRSVSYKTVHSMPLQLFICESQPSFQIVNISQSPRLYFESGGAKNIVTKRAQLWFAPTVIFFNFDPLICLKMTLFRTELDKKWGNIHK